jgi:hypothetical protein
MMISDAVETTIRSRAGLEVPSMATSAVHDRSRDATVIEPRWPIALTVGAFIVITMVVRFAQPERELLSPHWLVPAIEVGLLGVLLAANPAKVEGRARWLRRLSIILIGALGVIAVVSNVVLIVDLIRGSAVTRSGTALLASGALIWLGNALVFGLLYWQLDSGGPLARYRRDRPFPDFAFSQHMSPDLAPADWRPRYVDYLILGVTTSTAFSPTDVMPMVPWAKLMMASSL